MIPILHIHLLGDFRLVYGDTLVTTVNSPRLQSLLAYLLLHRHSPQSRQHLAFLLWPDSPELQARSNLRNLLHQLRQALPHANQFIHADVNTIYWLVDAPFSLDVAEFENLRLSVEQMGNTAQAKAALEKALSLYQGDLLPSCYDDWISPERERLHRRFIETMERLVQVLEDRRDYQAAIDYTQELLRFDLLHEAVYRRLMHLYALTGDRANALRVYQECAAVLRRELEVEPDAATRAVYERIKSAPALLAPLAQSLARPAAPPALVGREQEWGQLQQAWHMAMTGAPNFVLIIGEAGIGKTCLAEALLDWTARQGFATASAYCYAVEGGLAYAPIVSWLRSSALQTALQTLDDIWLVELVRLLPELGVKRPDLSQPEPLTESWQRQRLFEALVRAILAARQPLLLLLDDLQWCDRETLEWLHYYLRFDPQAPVLVVGTLRLEERRGNPVLAATLLTLHHRTRFSEILLGPLNPVDTAMLVATVAGQPLEPERIDRLYQETEGNPLFVVEMVRAALGRDWEEQKRGGESFSPISLYSRASSPLPAKVQAVIQARLLQLAPPARELAGLASVIGREFTFRVLLEAGSADEDTLVRNLNELEHYYIVREQGVDTYDFSHDKIREVVYTGLSVTHRRFLHRRVGEALAAIHTDNPELVSGQAAAHFEKAGSLDQAFRYYMRAADQAAGLHAFHKAEELYGRAVDLAKKLNLPDPKLIETYAAQGRMLEHLGRYADAIQVYHELEKLGRARHSQQMEGAAVAQLVTCYIEPNDTHNLESAEALIERGLALARELGDRDLESRLLWSKMVSVSHYGASEEAQTAGEASIFIARQHGLKKRLAYVLNDLATNLRLSGQLEQGQAYADEARRLFQEMNNLPMVADNLGQQAWSDYHSLAFDEALKHAAECTTLSQKIHNHWNLSMAALIRGMVWVARGEWGQALIDLAESMQFGEEAGFVIALTVTPIKLGALLREIGQLDRAWSLHQKAHAICLRQAPFLLHAIEAHLALDAFAGGQIEDGNRWLASMRQHAPRGAIPTAWLVLAEPALAETASAEYTDQWAMALDTVEQAIHEAQQRRLPLYFAGLTYQRGCCLSALGNLKEAEVELDKAITAAQAAVFRPVLWQAHAALSQLCRMQGRI
jgi:DNA-binding SARP family transcriptional activator